MNYVLSIITINFNNAQGLEKTIQSIHENKNKDIEYIIIDGSSNDRSLDIINQNQSIIDLWISESDNGIYDAMNKGVDRAHGQWVIFMNSGDEFVEDINILSLLDDQFHIIYGDCIVDKGNKKNKIGKSPINLKRGMCFCHQAMFFKTEVLKHNKFDTSLKISGDYDQIIRIYNQGYKFKRVDEFIAYISSGGLSDKKRISSLIESYHVCKKQGTCRTLNFFYRVVIESLKLVIKRVVQ